MIIKLGKPRFRSKVALFDFDWTLVRPKNGQTFPKDVDDWQWLRSNIPKIIKGYYQKGYGIYIVTNQTKEWKKDQIENVLKTLDIPIHICIAWKIEERKPTLFLFNEAFTEEQKKKIKKKDSFMCGDAMGRVNDHSDDDLKFAENIGVKCFTPEDIFPVEDVKTVKVKANKTQEAVIMVGYQGSGKSTICSEVFEPAGYYIAHGDELKTSIKMIKMAEIAVKEGKSVVFDATNPSKKKRAEYIEFAKTYKLPVRCIHVNTSLEDSLARNNKRDKPIPRIAFNIYTKNFEIPEESEGFEVVQI